MQRDKQGNLQVYQGAPVTVEFIRGVENFPRQKPRSTVTTLGTFDGIHRGHQAILRRVREVSAETSLNPALVTFYPHPRVLVTPNDIPLLLTTIQEKAKFIPSFFDGRVFVLNFDETLKNMTADEFVESILLDTLGTSKLIVGYDHHFGKNRGGTIDELYRLGDKHAFDVEVVEPVIYDNSPVSSSRIRRAIQEKQYSHALGLLGHDYAIYGVVEQGLGLGRKLGYPTANVRYSMRKLLPPEGVYACRAHLGDEEFGGMMFIGQNHFNPAKRVTVEANLFEFDRDIYDHEIIVYPTSFIRENKQFSSTDLLVAQIDRDKKNVLEILHKGASACQ
jgi:riboflavin kinase/FMN adenylyltransferase